MKRFLSKVIYAILLAVLVLGVYPKTALAASPSDVVIGNSYTLESGKELNSGLAILGGSANFMRGSTINGSVVLIGGSAQAAGTINGNLFVLGGTLNLANTFVLNGDLTYAGTVVNRASGSQINGQIHTSGNGPSTILPNGSSIPNLSSNFNPFLGVISFFLRLFLWALAAMVVAMFIPAYLARISQTALSQPLISGGMGLLTIIVLPIILVLLAITICLIPVSLIGVSILLIAWAFGLIALGLEVGKRISTMFKQEWHTAIAAGLGTLLLMSVLSGLEAIVPCVGWIPKVLAGLVGLGAVVLTQFGMKPYNPTLSLPVGGSTDTLPT